MASELPVDILLEVYNWYLVAEGQNPNNCRRRPILTFAAVCKSWRDVFTGLPFLWTKVVFLSRDKFNFDAYLQKSYPLPYNALLYFLPRRAFGDREEIRLQRQIQTSQVEAIADHIDRLQIFNIRPNSYHELVLCLLKFADLTADNLREIRVEIPPVVDVTKKLPDFNPIFPKAPNLKHISSPGKCAYMYPSDLSSLSTLDLFDIRFSVADFRDVFGSLPNLQTLSLAFSSIGELLDPFYAQKIHAFEVKELVDVPSLKYLSVELPSLITHGQCPCLLPIFHFPNLEVLDVSRRTFVFHRDDRNCHPKLHHFHPRTVQVWNERSSPFRKIRFKGNGWRWTPDIFTSPAPSPSVPSYNLFTKLLEMEWTDGVFAGAFCPVGSRMRYMEAKLNIVRMEEFDLPPHLQEQDVGIVLRWLQSIRDLLNGPVTAIMPTRLSHLTRLCTIAERCHRQLSVVFSNKIHTIWDDVREGGGDVPNYSIKPKTGKPW